MQKTKYAFVGFRKRSMNLRIKENNDVVVNGFHYHALQSTCTYPNGQAFTRLDDDFILFCR